MSIFMICIVRAAIRDALYVVITVQRVTAIDNLAAGISKLGALRLLISIKITRIERVEGGGEPKAREGIPNVGARQIVLGPQ